MLAFLPVLLIALVLFFLTRWSKAIDPAAAGSVALAMADGDALDIPVRAIESRGSFGSRTRNSMRPWLQMVPGGFRFHILRDGELPFAEIREIDVRKGLFGSAILHAAGRGRAFWFTLPDLATARAVVTALPAAVPLSTHAASLRDTPPAA